MMEKRSVPTVMLKTVKKNKTKPQRDSPLRG
jgi:hypothetical protein